MGYRTPNIDRIAKRGMMFTDSYGEQSCTAGAIVLHHRPERLRTGLSKVGIPGAPIGLRQDRDHCRLLKEQGYATGQFGKNHLGDLNTCCRPTMASTSSSATSITSTPKRSRRCTTIPAEDFPNFREHFGPRGVHPLLGDRQGRSDGAAALGPGRQAEDRGHRPAHQETDGNLRRRVRRGAAKDFIKRQHKAGKPFFVWLNTTACTCSPTQSRRASVRAGRWQSPYHDGMIDHDKNVGQMLGCSTSSASPTTPSSCTRPTTAAHEHLAGRRHDAVPQREEHQLGRRLPGAAAGPLAGQDRGRARSPTRSCSITTGCRPSWPWPASRT